MNYISNINSKPTAEPVAGAFDIFEFFEKKVQWHFRYKFGTPYIGEALHDDILRQLAALLDSKLDKGGICLDARMLYGDRPSKVEPVEEEACLEIWIGSRPCNMTASEYRAALKECIVDGFVGYPYEHLRNVVQIERMSTPVFTEETFNAARCPELEQTLRDVMSPKVPRQWRGHEPELLYRLQTALTEDDPLILRRLSIECLLAYVKLFESETDALREIIEGKPDGTLPRKEIPLPAGANPKVWQNILDGKNKHFAVLGGRTVLLADTETIGTLYGYMFRYYPRYGLGGRALVMKEDGSWDEPPVFGDFIRQFDLAGFDVETGEFTVDGEKVDVVPLFAGIRRGVIQKTPWETREEEIEREIAKDMARERRARKSGIRSDWFWM